MAPSEMGLDHELCVKESRVMSGHLQEGAGL